MNTFILLIVIVTYSFSAAADWSHQPLLEDIQFGRETDNRVLVCRTIEGYDRVVPQIQWRDDARPRSDYEPERLVFIFLGQGDIDLETARWVAALDCINQQTLRSWSEYYIRNGNEDESVLELASSLVVQSEKNSGE